MDAGDGPGKTDEEWSPLASGGEILRLSEPFRIGRHDWRLVVYRTNDRKVFSGYEWRRRATTVCGMRFGADRWRRDTDWPRYDTNDGQYAGLPKSTRKLWQQCPWASTEAVRALREAGESE